jgi:hypothetical protein
MVALYAFRVPNFLSEVSHLKHMDVLGLFGLWISI